MDRRTSPIMPEGFDMGTGASCGEGADRAAKSGFTPMAPSMSEKEAGAITIPSFESITFTGN